jgi:cell division protein FtsN
MPKDYREIQVSSTALVLIILCIIVLGAVIFFLGVQVGKKQADLLMKTMMAQKSEETVKATPPLLLAEEVTENVTSQKEPEKSLTTADSSAKTPTSQPETKPAVSGASSKTAVPRTEASSQPPSRTTTPAKVSVSAAGSGSYFIQIGAFNDRATARLEAEKFKKQGYNAVVKEPFPRDRKPLYRVWLGGYKTRDEAQKALNELVSHSVRNPGYFIVQQ